MNYDLVVLGTTTLALGLTKVVKNSYKTLIVEKTEMVAYEFVNTYKLPRVYSQGVEYYKEFRELGTDVLLKTDIVKIKKDDGGYTLEIFNGSGFQTVKTKILVDTTGKRDVKLLHKSLNCLLVNKSGDTLPEIELDGTQLTADFNGSYSTAILKYSCDTTLPIWEARHQLIEFWRKRPVCLKEWKIAAIAFCFEEKASPTVFRKEENYLVYPSCGFDNPAESYNAGTSLGRSLVS